MSMFYELMMRKKTQIMYATIKGSLTESPEGVFSGFSASNYLALQQSFKLNTDTVAEIVFKFNATSAGNGYGVLSTFGSYGILLNFNNSGKLALYIGDGTGSSFNILNGTLQSSQTISANTDYWGKLKFDKGVVSLLISTDGINYSGNNTTITLAQEYVYNLTYGIGRVGATYFRGSIDLNNSYIKLGSTKYNLQAVVGYTVVGSPTIVDGVVSGFSSSDYLQLPNFPTLDNNSKVEIYIESKFYDNSVNYAVLSAYNGDTYDIKIMLDAGKRLYGYVYNNANSTRYFARLWCSELTPTSLLYTKYTIQNNLLKLARKIDLLNWFETEVSLTENFSYTKSTPLCIGRSLNGEIYIKNTYIKINNKLWFNGQQA